MSSLFKRSFFLNVCTNGCQMLAMVKQLPIQTVDDIFTYIFNLVLSYYFLQANYHQR